MAQKIISPLQDRTGQKVNASGTASVSTAINLGGNIQELQTFRNAYNTSNGDTVVGVPVTLSNESFWQNGYGTFTHVTGQDTFTFTEITKSSYGDTTAVPFGLSTELRCSVSASMLASAALTIRSDTVTAANLNLVANHHHLLTISGLTDARYAVLPEARVGDRIRFTLVTDSDTTVDHVLALKTDAAGSLVDGVDLGTTASTRWVFFISGESYECECVKAGGVGDTDWVTVHDGRIAQTGKIYGSGAHQENIPDNTWTKVTVLNSSQFAKGILADTTNNKLVVRRDGYYLVNSGIVLDSSSTSGVLRAKATTATNTATINISPKTRIVSGYQGGALATNIAEMVVATNAEIYLWALVQGSSSDADIQASGGTYLEVAEQL